MRLPGALTVAMLGACVLAGCAQVDYTAPERYANGLVMVLDGAGGITLAPQQIQQGLNDGGVNHAIEIFKWSAGHNVLEDQQDVGRNRRVAGDLARRVGLYMSQYPGRPVHLMGLSAGTGIVVFAAEQIPASRPVDGICLMASSLSSTYDLTPALSHVRNEITNFQSSLADVGVLGVGVALAGTVDRGGGLSAGLAGFSVPKDASPLTQRLYEEKLVEMPYNPAYAIFGNLGDHLGATSPGFVKQFMAPIVLDAARRRSVGRSALPSAAPAGEE